MGRTANSGALTETVTYILLRLHRPAYGYALMKDIAQMTDGRVKLGAGSLYGALDTLQKKGWIRALDEHPQDRRLYGALDTLQKKGWIRALDEHPQDRRIEYIITDTGKEYFEKELLRLQELLKNAEKIKEVPYEDDR